MQLLVMRPLFTDQYQDPTPTKKFQPKILLYAGIRPITSDMRPFESSVIGQIPTLMKFFTLNFFVGSGLGIEYKMLVLTDMKSGS